jgi:hypothetical protein
MLVTALNPHWRWPVLLMVTAVISGIDPTNYLGNFGAVVDHVLNWAKG